MFRLTPATTPGGAQPPVIAPPLVTGHSQTLHVGNTVSVASLFTVTDPNLLPITGYQIAEHGGLSRVQLNGAANLATQAQQAAGITIVSAGDLGKLDYTVPSAGEESLTITAFDGQSWGSANVTIGGSADPPPTVTGSSISLHATRQMLTASTLFTVTDQAAHSITQYRFIDTGNTGQVKLADPKLNLATNEEAAQGIYRVAADALAAVQFQVMASTGSFAVSAFDGTQWSDYATVTVAGQNDAPIVTPSARKTISVGQPVALTSLFSVKDPNGDAVTTVSIYDYYQNIQLNGATDLCPDPHTFEVSLSDLAKLTYTAPNVMGGLQGLSVYAYDGTSWSTPVSVTFTIQDPHPVVHPGSTTQVAVNQAVPLSQLISAVDPNRGTITKYEVQDPAHGGSLHLNGAVNLASAAQKAAGISLFAASDLAKVRYVGGATAGGETLVVSAYNGKQWGSANIPIETTDGRSPVVGAGATTVDLSETVPVTDLFTVGNPSGKAITEYSIVDPSGGGTLMLNDAKNLATADQQAQRISMVSAADLSKVEYLGAAADGSEILSIGAFDGSHWGQADILVTSKNNNRPVVTAKPVTLHAGESVSLVDLFSVSDANGQPILSYQINDDNQRLQLNGATNIYASQQFQGVYGIDAREMAKVAYVAGAPGTATIRIEASDLTGTSVSAGETITILPNPVVTAATPAVPVLQSVPLSSLVIVTNPSGKPIIEYSVKDPSGGGTVQLNGAANLATADQKAMGITLVSAADFAHLQYRGAASFGSEALLVSAYDGDSWGSSAITVTSTDGAPPQITAPAASVEINGTVQFGDLFSSQTRSGQAITKYKVIDPAGGGTLLLNGATNFATAAEQAQQGMAIVAATDLGKLQYVGALTPGNETLKVSAFDGQSWGTADLVIASVNSAPPVIDQRVASLSPGQTVALSTLFSITDPNGFPISAYIFNDPGQQIKLNGATNFWATQQSSGYYWISPADLPKITFVAGTAGVSHLGVIVSDGHNYSAWTDEMIVVGKDSLILPPQIAPATTTVPLGQSVPLSTLFTVTDPLGNAISQYKVLDPAGGGAIELNGAQNLATPDQQAAGVAIFAAPDLGKVQYQGSSLAGAESLTVSAYDGQAWGNADIAVTSAHLPPGFTPATTTVDVGQAISLSALFTLSTPSGAAVTAYRVQDPAGGGQLLLNGASDLATAAEQAQGIAVFAASDLAKVRYAAAASSGSETLMISATDGQDWGTVNLAINSTDNRPPTIAATASAVDTTETVWLSSLFKAGSPSGKPILQYEIQDPAGGGQIVLNTATNLATPDQTKQGISIVAAYDVTSVLYVGGSAPGSETLKIAAFDGNNWANADLKIDSVAKAPPVVTALPVTLHVGQSVALSSLYSVVDPNGYAIRNYIVTDADLCINLNGAANLYTSPLWDYNGHYYFTAADIAKPTYVATTVGVVHIGMQVDDGHNYSGYVDETITIVAAAADHAAQPLIGAISGSAAPIHPLG